MKTPEEHDYYLMTINKLENKDTTINEWASRAFADKDFLTIFLKLLNNITPNSDKNILDKSVFMTEEEFKEKVYIILMGAMEACKK